MPWTAIETATSPAPPPNAGVAHSKCVDETNLAADASEPKRHCRELVSTKFSPKTDTTVPPAAGPFDGESSTSAGCRTYENSIRLVVIACPPWPSSTATTASASSWGGATQTISVSEITSVSRAASPPKTHWRSASDSKPAPVTVTFEPPVSGPIAGEMPLRKRLW